MARAIWSGTISFGLLNVPVKLYSAVSRKTIRFNDLRASDGSRVRNRRVAEDTEEEVPYEEIVKGYEISPDRYVVMTREELSELDPKKTRSIEIQDFVEIGRSTRSTSRTPTTSARPRERRRPTRCWPRRWSPPARRRSPASYCATASTWRRSAPPTGS